MTEVEQGFEKPKPKTNSIHFRVTDDELELIRELSRKTGKSQATVLRDLLTRGLKYIPTTNQVQTQQQNQKITMLKEALRMFFEIFISANKRGDIVLSDEERETLKKIQEVANSV